MFSAGVAPDVCSALQRAPFVLFLPAVRLLKTASGGGGSRNTNAGVKNKGTIRTSEYNDQSYGAYACDIKTSYAEIRLLMPTE